MRGLLIGWLFERRGRLSDGWKVLVGVLVA